MIPRFELNEDLQRLSRWARLPVSSLLLNRSKQEVPGRKLHPVLRPLSAERRPRAGLDARGADSFLRL